MEQCLKRIGFALLDPRIEFGNKLRQAALTGVDANTRQRQIESLAGGDVDPERALAVVFAKPVVFPRQAVADVASKGLHERPVATVALKDLQGVLQPVAIEPQQVECFGVFEGQKREAEPVGGHHFGNEQLPQAFVAAGRHTALGQREQRLRQVLKAYLPAVGFADPDRVADDSEVFPEWADAVIHRVAGEEGVVADVGVAEIHPGIELTGTVQQIAMMVVGVHHLRVGFFGAGKAVAHEVRFVGVIGIQQADVVALSQGQPLVHRRVDAAIGLRYVVLEAVAPALEDFQGAVGAAAVYQDVLDVVVGLLGDGVQAALDGAFVVVDDGDDRYQRAVFGVRCRSAAHRSAPALGLAFRVCRARLVQSGNGRRRRR